MTKPFHYLLLAILCTAGMAAARDETPLVRNADFRAHDDAESPTGYTLTGNIAYRYLGDPARDASGWGVALQSSKRSGAVSQMVGNLNPAAGRWFRFTFRGLPQDYFEVTDDRLYMRVEYFADNGKTRFDGKEKRLFSLVQQDRRDLAANGDHHIGGAAVWRTYQLDFWLPFPQVDQVKLSVGFDRGAATKDILSDFFVTDFSLARIDGLSLAATQPTMTDKPAQKLAGTMLPLGGRWYYLPKDGEAIFPRRFDYTNADRLIYHDDKWTAPFAGEMTSWLRAGDKDMDGNIVTEDRYVPDNVSIQFDGSSLVVHTKNLPNHPTGKFPEQGGGRRNPSYIQEQSDTFYIPVNPEVNIRHIATALDNSNHALPMGPIGLAINGVVFFNPFDAGNMDASNLMDRCCGHPNQDNLYHYHKYPICMYSPWRDEGKGHSPVIGWAFDGFPVYGPYEKAGVMAKDLTGDNALNEFNLHFDKERGWHYHVTPGKFPYIIGGYWGTEDVRDQQRPHHPRGSGPPQ